MRKKQHLIPGIHGSGRNADAPGTAGDGIDHVSTAGEPAEASTKGLALRSRGWVWFLAASIAAGLAAGLEIDPLFFAFITVALFFLVLVRANRLAVSVEEHRSVLARLRSTEALYRSLVETNPTVTYVDVLEPGSEAGYRTRYMSPQIEGWVGHPPQAFLDDPGLWLRLVHPEDHDAVEATHERHYATGERLQLEYRLVGKDGRVVWIRDHAEVLQDEDGRPVAQGVAHDITERRIAEEAERARQAAEEANRARRAPLQSQPRAAHAVERDPGLRAVAADVRSVGGRSGERRPCGRRRPPPPRARRRDPRDLTGATGRGLPRGADRCPRPRDGCARARGARRSRARRRGHRARSAAAPRPGRGRAPPAGAVSPPRPHGARRAGRGAV